MQGMIFELCAETIDACFAAREGGAHRIELCSGLSEGGVTPSHGLILDAVGRSGLPVHVLIRPRGGDFLYNDTEFETMLADVDLCSQSGCHGVVTGILNHDGTVDKIRNAQIVKIAKKAGMGLTFHRAFDMCADQFQALEDIIELGFERILTSGGRSTAMEGASVIAHLVEKAAGRIAIMPGGGIDEHNVADLVHYTGVKEIHASARSNVQSHMKYKNDHIIMSDSPNDEYSFSQTNVDRVKALITLANK